LGILNGIDIEYLSDAARKAWMQVYDTLTPGPLFAGPFAIDVQLRASPEIHIRTNADMPSLRTYHDTPFSWNDYPKDWGRENGDFVGSLFSLDIDWTIAPSIAFYGQVVVNQFTIPSEKGRLNAPQAMGLLGGIEHTRAFGQWRAQFYGEAVYLMPYLYMNSSPFNSFIWMRRLTEWNGRPLQYRWIGHPEGRDTILFAIGAEFEKADLQFVMDAAYALQGEHTIQWD
jgi:hypothetical protein